MSSRESFTDVLSMCTVSNTKDYKETLRMDHSNHILLL